MSNKVFYSCLFVLLFHTVFGSYFLFKSEKGVYSSKIPVYTGIIQSKEAQDYKCGKHQRYTCTKYLFQIDDLVFEVTEEEFSNNPIGASFTQTVIRDNSPFYVKYFILSLLPLYILIPIALGIGLAEETIRKDKEEEERKKISYEKIN